MLHRMREIYTVHQEARSFLDRHLLEPATHDNKDTETVVGKIKGNP